MTNRAGNWQPVESLTLHAGDAISVHLELDPDDAAMMLANGSSLLLEVIKLEDDRDQPYLAVVPRIYVKPEIAIASD